MKKISSIQVIDSLAEMTRHQDREVIEKSLLKTIDELMPSTELQLFKIIVEETSEISLYLLSYSINGDVNIIDMKFNYGQMSTSLQKGIVNAVEYADLQQVEGISLHTTSKLDLLACWPFEYRTRNLESFGIRSRYFWHQGHHLIFAPRNHPMSLSFLARC